MKQVCPFDELFRLYTLFNFEIIFNFSRQHYVDLFGILEHDSAIKSVENMLSQKSRKMPLNFQLFWVKYFNLNTSSNNYQKII